MKRPTILDLANAAGVSTSTVNRLLHGKGSVRSDSADQIRLAAEEIGFYGLGAIKKRSIASLPQFRLGFLLQQSTRPLYQMFGQSIQEATARRADSRIDAKVAFEDDLAPESIAANLIKLGRECDAVSVIAADHPLVNQAVEQLRVEGVPVVTYITDLSTTTRAGYVGTNNWKLGRTAAWFMSQTTQQRQGKVVTFIGNHRYQCQDIADASFRSYVRECAPHLTVEDALPTQELPANAYELVRERLKKDVGMVGIFITGGGISGVLQALREVDEEKRKQVRLVCRDIGPEIRKGLSENLILAALCHPLEQVSDALIDTMLSAIKQKEGLLPIQRIVPFEIITPESV